MAGEYLMASERHIPLVSFVVPTKDAASTLGRCLESLARQDHPAVEVIVVDNGSTDDTMAIAARRADIAVSYGPERSAQRNEGARLARGEIVVFVDADMVLEPEVARECAELFAERPMVGGLVLPELSFGRGYLARCRALEKRLYLGDDGVEAARAFRTEVFHSVGGYELQMNAFEDWDLADRVRARGWVIDRIDSLVWHDDGRVSAVRQFRKKRYYGRQSGRYLARRETPRRRRVLRSSLWRHPRQLLARPWLLPGLAWLKLAEASGIAMGAVGALRVTRARLHVAPCRRPQSEECCTSSASFTSTKGSAARSSRRLPGATPNTISWRPASDRGASGSPPHIASAARWRRSRCFGADGCAQ